MNNNSIWSEIHVARLESKHELTLSGEKLAEKVSQNNGAIDESLYELGKQLNYLKLAKLELTKISPKISNLTQLTQLSIIDNKVTEIPIEMSQLINLVYLDLSENHITSMPNIFTNLSKLRTVNLRSNKINNIASFNGCILLQELFLDHNALSCFPEDIFNLMQLMTLDLSNNKIREIPIKVSQLKNLKTLNLENNQIDSVISELGHMNRLKQIQLKNNPLKNVKTQLKKMINDNLYKAIFDNLKKIETHSSKRQPSNNQRSSSTMKRESSDGETDEIGKFITVTVENTQRQIIIKNRSDMLRPQVVYFIVHNMVFTQEKLKRFIKFQEQLHKNECENRKFHTVGVHDLSAVNFPLVYSTKPPESFTIQMINGLKPESGKSLYERLLKEAELERKSKKRGNISGVYQYLYMVDIDSSQGVVEDCNETIISYPPLSNCNLTKMSADTTDLLVEVIGTKLDKCKSICESIIQWLIENEISNTTSCLEIEPVRIYEDNSEVSSDDGRNLLVVFPSRADLNSLGINVKRE